jgi:hypothetical protein
MAQPSLGQQQIVDCGSSVNGLRICLATSNSYLMLALQNVSEHDLTLNLGVTMANGKIQLPGRIAITFTDAQGKTRIFKFADKRYAGVAGRLDDYVVPLRAGSTYTVVLKPDQFWCQETNEFSIVLSDNSRLTAQYEGAVANAVNGDMAGIKLMSFWLGKIESNTLAFRR